MALAPAWRVQVQHRKTSKKYPCVYTLQQNLTEQHCACFGLMFTPEFGCPWERHSCSSSRPLVSLQLLTATWACSYSRGQPAINLPIALLSLM